MRGFSMDILGILLPVEIDMFTAIAAWTHKSWKVVLGALVALLALLLVSFTVFALVMAFTCDTGDQATYVQAVVVSLQALLTLVLTGGLVYATWLYVDYTRELAEASRAQLEQGRAANEERIRRRGRDILLTPGVGGGPLAEIERNGDTERIKTLEANSRTYLRLFDAHAYSSYESGKIQSRIRRDFAERIEKVYRKALKFDSERNELRAAPRGPSESLEMREDYNHEAWIEKAEAIVYEFRSLHEDLHDYYIVQSAELE